MSICATCRSKLSRQLRKALSRNPDRCFSNSVSARQPTVSKTKLPKEPARTRFAPSPTGNVHLGSLRTALFNYLLAKRTKGQFLLRLEDTDRKRTIEHAEQRLYNDLRWAGLQWDEGPEVGGPYGPYRQSERTSIYRQHAEELLETPHAYRCFCSADRLQQLAEQRMKLGLPTDYDRACESIPKAEAEDRASRGEAFTVRLRAPAAYPVFEDVVYGAVGRKGIGASAGVTHKYGEVAYEDPILMKSDGHPTYHFANVVDDHLMKITHVVRATEWLSSTPKHLALYQAFGWEPPVFAHVGLLTDEHGQKMSKRKMQNGIAAEREAGILPAALINFVALLGLSYQRKSDVMDLSDMVREFDMRFTRGNAAVTGEKLRYLQKAHAARAAAVPESSAFQTMKSVLFDVAVRELRLTPNASTMQDEAILQARVTKMLKADARNYENAEQFWNRNKNLFIAPTRRETFVGTDSTDLDMVSLDKMTAPLWDLAPEMWTDAHREQLLNLLRWLSLPATTQEQVDRHAKVAFTPKSDESKRHGLHCHYLRWALLGTEEGPGIVEILLILGREESKKRYDEAISEL